MQGRFKCTMFEKTPYLDLLVICLKRNFNHYLSYENGEIDTIFIQIKAIKIIYCQIVLT
jgi:hypothetical protein